MHTQHRRAFAKRQLWKIGIRKERITINIWLLSLFLFSACLFWKELTSVDRQECVLRAWREEQARYLLAPSSEERHSLRISWGLMIACALRRCHHLLFGAQWLGMHWDGALPSSAAADVLARTCCVSAPGALLRFLFLVLAQWGFLMHTSGSLLPSFSGTSVQGIRIYAPVHPCMGGQNHVLFHAWVFWGVLLDCKGAHGVMACALLLSHIGKNIVNMYLSYLRYYTILTKFSSGIGLVNTKKNLTNTNQKNWFNIQL